MHFTAGPEDPLYQFGAFTADPVVGRLHHASGEVALTPKAFKVLMVLLESPGSLVDKEDLLQQVWPDTFVEPNNLARHVSMIRRALHELDSDHEHIVTVSGRGYRFVTPVGRITRAAFAGHSRPAAEKRVADPGFEETAAALRLMPEGPHEPLAEAGPVNGPRWRPALAVTALLAGLLSVAGALAIGYRADGAGPGGSRRLWQLTTAGRLDGEPTWSPDGESIAYSSDRDGSPKIWMQRIRGGTPIQLTTGGARDWQPSWSPDARHVAFRSERDGGGIFVVPVAGGGARRLTAFGHQPQWSPDGSRILFCSGRDVHLAALDGSTPSQVASDVLPNLPGRCRVAWHPDGQRISVYGRHQEHGPTLLTLPLRGGAPVRSAVASSVEQRLREADLRLGSFVWSPRGDALYFEGLSDRTQNVWRIRVNPRTLELIAGPDRLTTSPGHDNALALAPDGRRLAFGSRFERTSVWSLPFDPIEGRITGDGHAVTPEGANAKILDISPDGKQLVYRVTARDTDELWIRSLDRQVDRLRKVEVDAAIIHPRWSRDGTQLAYLRRPVDQSQPSSVVLIAADSDDERHLAPGEQHLEMVYDWSLDGRGFLVRCRSNTGPWAICRWSASPGPRAALHVIASDATRNLYAAAYSPDGEWVSFIAARNLTQSAVLVSPATGGAWVPVTSSDDQAFRDLPRWSPDGRTLYFLSNHTGFWNVWGRRFDPEAGKPSGQPFQISRFDSSVQMVGPDVSALQLAVTRDRLILPVTQASGAVWILEDVDH